MRAVALPLIISSLLFSAGAVFAANPVLDLGGKIDVEILGYVIDSKAVVRAGTHQHFVNPGQGWAAVKLKVTQSANGHVNADTIYVSRPVIGSMPQLTWHCSDGEWYRLRLRLDTELSKWCEFDVYELVGGIQVQRPNQLSEPTSPSVTPAAGAAGAPSVATAH